MEVLRKADYISGFIYTDQATIPELTHCGEATYDGSHRSLFHHHPGFEFIYLARGTATRYVGEQATSQQMGDIFIAHPNEKHRVDCLPSEEGHQLWVGLRLDQLGQEGRNLSNLLRKRKPRLVHGCQSVESALQGVIRQMTRERPDRREAIRAFLRTFCVLLRQVILGGGEEGAILAKGGWPYTRGISMAIAHMEQNLNRRLSLLEITETAGAANASRFCTQFHREVKKTPAAYHLQLRLASAREALLQPSNSVTAVAMEHGFCSAQHFCAAFRRAFGVTATGWRKQGAVGRGPAVA